jgi:D-2-hydroxyacid dehydrogenase (NADP+)
MRTLVIFPGPEPMWSAAPDVFRSSSPQIDFRFATGLAQASAHADEAEAVVSFFLDEAFVQRARSLRWIQSLGAGVDELLGLPALSPGVIVTSMAGLSAAAVAEAALTSLLTQFRRVQDAVHNQDARRWVPMVSRLLAGSTVGIVGLGAVGAALASRCRALGMRVVGFSATTGERPDFDAVYARELLAERAGECDALVLCAALSPQTRRLVNASVLEAMKPGAVLVNVARGDLIDERELLAALRSGTLAGAALDVFATEPLPPDHPLWDEPRVSITAHSAGRYDRYVADAAGIFATNAVRYAAGDIARMINVVRA